MRYFLLLFAALSIPTSTATIPASSGTALDGHTVKLPGDLPARATILILGFSRDSASTTTAWEKPIRTNLSSPPAIGYYDMPFLEDAPALLRPIILHSIRRQVPSVLKPNFVPLTTHEAAWKQVAGYSTAAPDAAYVLLVDRSGGVRWRTHDPFNPNLFGQLSAAARQLADKSK